MSDDFSTPHANASLSTDESLLLARQVAMLSASGLPLGPGLRATAEELPRGNLRTTLSALADAIDRGESIDKAMLAHGELMPRHLQGIVLAGVRTGKLSHVLGRFVMFSNVGVDIRRNLWLNLLYPLMAITIASLILMFVCSYLVSSFATIFRDFGMSLPHITLALIGISNFLVQKAPGVLMALATVVGLYVAARLCLSTSVRRGLATYIPVLGGVWTSTAIAEFCHLLGLLIECEIPLPTALGLTGIGVRNSEIEHACDRMQAEVIKGVPLSEAVKGQRIFPKGIVRILKWAEGHQGLAESLHMTGDILEARARVQTALAGTICTVLSIVLILLGVSVTVTALFIPLIRLISLLSG